MLVSINNLCLTILWVSFMHYQIMQLIGYSEFFAFFFLNKEKKPSTKNSTDWNHLQVNFTVRAVSFSHRYHIFGPESQVMRSKYNVFEGKQVYCASNAGSECMHVAPTLSYSITTLYCYLWKSACNYLKSPLQRSVSSFFSWGRLLEPVCTISKSLMMWTRR